MQASAIVLAAGEGTRMRSSLSKVAHQILGVPMVRFVVDSVHAAGIARVVTVVGHHAEVVSAIVSDTEIAHQERRLGTGDAVSRAREAFAGVDGCVVVLAGDVPLIRAETIRALVDAYESSETACVMLTARFADPDGYGRVVRGPLGRVAAIVEHRDLKPDQGWIGECNVGVYCFDVHELFDRVACLEPANTQGELYLTDVIGMLVADGLEVDAIETAEPEECLGVNTRVQLAHASRLMQRRINLSHMLSGVTMTDPDLAWVSPGVTLARDVVLEPMTFLVGDVTVGEGAVIGPSTRIENGKVGSGATVERSVVCDAVIGDRATVGPNAYLRPGTVLAAGSKVGSFVEVKNSTIGEGSKVPHLSYVGDATIGHDTNVGAGSITCNYDGFEKHTTVIGDGAFIGSDTMLVAPVSVGDGAMTGAGSVISKDVPPGALGIERSEQRNIEGFAERREAHGPDVRKA
jgi:bifunctional UDP-N-acetylglucosamine pyrophosphorylase/glucosamine-1-phosphate N-acetyltransferase